MTIPCKRPWGAVCLALGLALAACAQAPSQAAPTNIDLDQAISLALAHSPALAAARTQIPQSQAQEVTAAIRPNPVLSWDALFLPVFTPSNFNATYLKNNAEFDASVGYTIERGHKRQARIQAARDATSVVRSQVQDSARGLTFNVAQQFISALLAHSSLEFAQQDLDSWQHTVSIGEARKNAGAISQGDLDTLQLQTLGFQQTVSADRLSLAQALSGLRQQIGFSGLPVNYTVAGDLTFTPVRGNLDDFKALALQHRPDLMAAHAAVVAAESQRKLALADGKRDLTTTVQYSHVAAFNTAGALFNIEIPIFDRNQGEIARTVAAETQASDQARQTEEQVYTDVATAFSAVEEGAKVVALYTEPATPGGAGYRDQAKQALKIRQYSYARGASSLLDLLDAERTYRATELGYRQALAAYMTAVEQLKEAVGTRTLP